MTDRKQETRVSRQEELLYGPYAPLVRRLGNMAEAAEAARVELENMLCGSRESDDVTKHATTATGYDDKGQSAHTLWLNDVYERLWPVVGGAYDAHRDITLECLERWIETRQSVDSQPAPNVHDGELLATEPPTGIGVGHPISNALTEDALSAILARAGGDRSRRWMLYVGSTPLELTAKRIVASGHGPLDGLFDVMLYEALSPEQWMVQPPAGTGG